MKKLSLDNLSAGYDIVVVGAGPAGCMLTKNLADQFSVLLVDSKTLPRDKPCGGLLVEEAQKIVNEFNPPKKVFVEPKYPKIVYADWDNNIEKTIKKNFLNIDREKFDYWLFSLLKRKDFHFIDKTKLVDFSYTKHKDNVVLVLESDGDVKSVITKYLIGCDGAISRIRNKLLGREVPYYIALQEKIRHKTNDELVYFIYDSMITDFYSWIIPKDHSVTIGSALHPYNAREKFEILKKKIGEKLNINGQGILDSALLLRPNSLRDIYLGDKNIILAGEAAGLISPSSGEGISFAMESGLHCANALNKEYKTPLSTYKSSCTHLIERITKKMLKSKSISNKYRRVKLMQK